MTMTREDIVRLSVPPPRSLAELEALVTALEADKMAMAAQVAKALDRATAAEARVANVPGPLLTQEAEVMRIAASLPHAPTLLTFHARQAVEGDGPLAYEWQDKPHRLVFDLCQEIERIAAGQPAQMSPRQEVVAVLNALEAPHA